VLPVVVIRLAEVEGAFEQYCRFVSVAAKLRGRLGGDGGGGLDGLDLLGRNRLDPLCRLDPLARLLNAWKIVVVGELAAGVGE